ncbi:hypothetical protein [Algoriphagus boritolerans]|uniref:NVEALA protein n=1 Tax=Algoriphagus boritolerans DSM 17298 = JCM 18970 TaxID=1120964 RepID=A0A1H5SZ51_9BACT|nr:hypothetical protein [Algoriphagus boritolerans]SEF55816.1 hypothetical protein SAMN03080598_00598 [Algoriphagus boritolerans DSM 17298 = JCM 18970]
MKKLLIVGAFIIMAFPSFADTRGETRDYYGEVECPNGDVIEVRGKCCEPGGIWYCNYVSCANYNPVTPTCPSIGG